MSSGCATNDVCVYEHNNGGGGSLTVPSGALGVGQHTWRPEMDITVFRQLMLQIPRRRLDGSHYYQCGLLQVHTSTTILAEELKNKKIATGKVAKC